MSTTSNHGDHYRPPVEERWIDGMRTEPAQIEFRTRWLYSDPDPRAVLPEGRTRHPFGRGGHVTKADIVPEHETWRDFQGYIKHALKAFGDDKDLVIEVRLKEERSTDTETSFDGRLSPSKDQITAMARHLYLSQSTSPHASEHWDSMDEDDWTRQEWIETVRSTLEAAQNIN